MTKHRKPNGKPLDELDVPVFVEDEEKTVPDRPVTLPPREAMCTPPHGVAPERFPSRPPAAPKPWYRKARKLGIIAGTVMAVAAALRTIAELVQTFRH
jgi:hypothetical protein